MRQLLRQNGYFVSVLLLAGGFTTACEKIENTPPTQNDSLAVVPIGPGTRPDAIIPPDTPESNKDTLSQRESVRTRERE
jgi:hypothetical protein